MPAAMDAGGALVDHDRLADLVAAIGHAAVAETLELLHMEGGNQIERLLMALARRDAAQVRFEAHALKSAAGTLGLVRLQALAATIESAARRNDLAPADRLGTELAGLFELAIGQARAMLGAMRADALVPA